MTGPKLYTTELLDPRKARARATKGISDPHEADVAADLGGRKHRGSGSSPWLKGDVSADPLGLGAEVLVECKATAGASIGVKAEWLIKVTREADEQAGRVPALALRFDRIGELAQGTEADWIAVPLSEFRRLLRRAEADDE